MYLRFRGEKPDTPGKLFFRSYESLSMTFAPQPSPSCRATIILPIRQYMSVIPTFAETIALVLSAETSALTSDRNFG